MRPSYGPVDGRSGAVRGVRVVGRSRSGRGVMGRPSLSPEQQAVFELIENTREHVFVTGRAGTGKSTLLNHLSWNTEKSLVISAPTGVAALNVGGQTIHSLFRLPIGVIADHDIDQSGRAAQAAQQHRHARDRRGVDGQRRPDGCGRPQPAPGAAAPGRGRSAACRWCCSAIPFQLAPVPGDPRGARVLRRHATARCGSSTPRSGDEADLRSRAGCQCTGSTSSEFSAC